MDDCLPATRHSNCHDLFHPRVAKEHSPEKVNFVSGTSYFLCCWVNHFGHILMDMMLPSFLSIRSFDHNISSVQIIVDNRFTFKWGSNSTVLKLLQNLSPTRPILDISAGVHHAENFSPMCFEKLIVGLGNTNFIHPTKPENTSATDLRAFRDHLLRLHVKSTPRNICKIFILQRPSMRRFHNIEDIVARTKANNSSWNVEVGHFDKVPFFYQMEKISNADIYLHSWNWISFKLVPS